MYRYALLFCIGFSFFFSVQSQQYWQKIQTNVELPIAAGKNVIRLFHSASGIVAVTSTGVFRYDEIWSGHVLDENIIAATQNSNDDIWLATYNNIHKYNSEVVIPLPEDLKGYPVLSMFWENDATLHIGSTHGLYTWNNGWQKSNIITGIRVNDIQLADSCLWVASNNGLWRRKNNKWANMDDVLMATGNQRQYFALAATHNQSNLLLSTPWSVATIAANGDHSAWTSADGLPYGPVTVIRAFADDIWLGTANGAIQKNSKWHYYGGKRWLPSSTVNDILETGDGIVWVATPEGISEIAEIPMTLSEKAAVFEEEIEMRHNRNGIVNVAKLGTPGLLSSSYTENEDNDGLWTSCYLAAVCYKYAVTKDDETRRIAVRTFEALERLETITGISGYPARSYARAEDSVTQSKSPHPKQWHYSPDKKWQWLDDTSSDEITGHLFTLSLFHELVADKNQKKRVVDLIDRIVTHIINNNYHLIDKDGKPTKWGIWNPDSLNHSPNWMTEKGLNSLQILSHLKTALHYTGNKKYETAYQYLVQKHGYAQNALVAKNYGPFETSHSDDILNFFPYYGLIHYTKNDPNKSIYIQSLERSWKAVSQDRMPVWNVIASALLKKDCGLDIAAEELEAYPMDLIDWTMQNSHRWDIVKDPLVDRSGKIQSVSPIPSAESSVSRWNTNPKRLDSGNGGQTVETGTYFLMAYWMGRYYGFFK